MSAHIGVDTHSELVRSVVGTADTVNDVAQASAPRQGLEGAVFGDAGH